MNFLLKLQTIILSFFINFIKGDYYHNVSKFYEIYKIWNNVKLDSIQGNYIEFGIFKGKSLIHSYKTYKNIFQKNPTINFYGLDSFEGFPVENHNFYNSANFAVSSKKVIKSFKKYDQIKIFDGYFDEVINSEETLLDQQFSFVFIDCDIYESSLDIFEYIKGKVSNGGFIMIDDFTSIDTNGNSIQKAFEKNFIINKDVVLFDFYSNGQVFRVING
jgi:O-methyltransferase|tara:strand:+ start:201 stop:851 length:651 start_codon:yes stop_codon:yes gene_type:complete